jgi:hypothetical protein
MSRCPSALRSTTAMPGPPLALMRNRLAERDAAPETPQDTVTQAIRVWR